MERPIRYLRQSFVYARDFVSDEDLNAQAGLWLSRIANGRWHRTIGDRPQDRFTRVEQPALLQLAGRPYRSLILPPRPPSPSVRSVPQVQVERRPLAQYAALAAGAL